MNKKKQRAKLTPAAQSQATTQRKALEELENVPYHATTQHTPHLHEQDKKAGSLAPQSQQRRFPR